MTSRAKNINHPLSQLKLLFLLQIFFFCLTADGGWKMSKAGGFLRDHARSVNHTSPGTTRLRNTSRTVESHGKRHFSWWPTDKNEGVGLPNVLDMGWTKV